MVFAVFGLPKLVYEQLYTVWGWSEEGQALEMPHFFPLLIIESVCEVYGVVKEGGLGRCGRDNRYLFQSSENASAIVPN